MKNSSVKGDKPQTSSCIVGSAVKAAEDYMTKIVIDLRADLQKSRKQQPINGNGEEETVRKYIDDGDRREASHEEKMLFFAETLLDKIKTHYSSGDVTAVTTQELLEGISCLAKSAKDGLKSANRLNRPYSTESAAKASYIREDNKPKGEVAGNPTLSFATDKKDRDMINKITAGLLEVVQREIETISVGPDRPPSNITAAKIVGHGRINGDEHSRKF